jgi:hypothetical protein
MRVLVVEGAPGAGAGAKQALTDAGHEVTDCHDSGTSFPCHGLGDGPGCPLDEAGGIDVTVLVRATADPNTTASEDGVRCALRNHIPLAVTGAVEANPYTSMAAEVSPGLDDVVGAAERAAAQPLAAHAEVARGALRALLDIEGLDTSGADAVVTRTGTMLTVTLVPGIELAPMMVETASVRALAAVRAFDHSASIIDVTVA